MRDRKPWLDVSTHDYLRFGCPENVATNALGKMYEHSLSVKDQQLTL